MALPLGEGPLPRLRRKLRDLSDCLRYEDAARLRDRIASLERVLGHLRTLDALRGQELCLVVPAREPGWSRAYFLAAGRLCAERTLPPGAGASVELEAGIAAARAAAADGVSYAAEACDELLLVASFLRRPPPELSVFQLGQPRSRGALSADFPATRSAPLPMGGVRPASIMGPGRRSDDR